MNERQYFHVVVTLGNERTTIFSYCDDLGQWTKDDILYLIYILQYYPLSNPTARSI